MTKEKIIIIIVAIILIILIFVGITKNKNVKKEEHKNEIINIVEDNGRYIVYDENGQEVYNGIDRAEADFYRLHPDYDTGFERSDEDIYIAED